MAELGIVDIREINRVIKSLYDYDFSNYALTSYKQRLERLLTVFNIPSVESLLNKLQNDHDFFDLFLYEMSVPSTEMFRDPSLWRWLREEFFPNNIEKNVSKLKIWIPACVSGGELFTLLILLAEMNIIDKVQITASSISEKSIGLIKEGYYDFKKIEVSRENYIRFNGQNDLSAYYKIDREQVKRNTSLLAEVDFKKLNINFDNSPQNVKLILFRNNMIYYNPNRQETILQVLHRTLSASGHLIIGIREKISGLVSAKDFEIVNEAESIYRKKF